MSGAIRQTRVAYGSRTLDTYVAADDSAALPAGTLETYDPRTVVERTPAATVVRDADATFNLQVRFPSTPGQPCSKIEIGNPGRQTTVVEVPLPVPVEFAALPPPIEGAQRVEMRGTAEGFAILVFTDDQRGHEYRFAGGRLQRDGPFDDRSLASRLGEFARTHAAALGIAGGVVVAASGGVAAVPHLGLAWGLPLALGGGLAGGLVPAHLLAAAADRAAAAGQHRVDERTTRLHREARADSLQALEDTMAARGRTHDLPLARVLQDGNRLLARFRDTNHVLVADGVGDKDDVLWVTEGSGLAYGEPGRRLGEHNRAIPASGLTVFGSDQAEVDRCGSDRGRKILFDAAAGALTVSFKNYALDETARYDLRSGTIHYTYSYNDPRDPDGDQFEMNVQQGKVTILQSSAPTVTYEGQGKFKGAHTYSLPIPPESLGQTVQMASSPAPPRSTAPLTHPKFMAVFESGPQDVSPEAAQQVLSGELEGASALYAFGPFGRRLVEDKEHLLAIDFFDGNGPAAPLREPDLAGSLRTIGGRFPLSQESRLGPLVLYHEWVRDPQMPRTCQATYGPGAALELSSRDLADAPGTMQLLSDLADRHQRMTAACSDPDLVNAVTTRLGGGRKLDADAEAAFGALWKLHPQADACQADLSCILEARLPDESLADAAAAFEALHQQAFPQNAALARQAFSFLRGDGFRALPGNDPDVKAERYLALCGTLQDHDLAVRLWDAMQAGGEEKPFRESLAHLDAMRQVVPDEALGDAFEFAAGPLLQGGPEGVSADKRREVHLHLLQRLGPPHAARGWELVSKARDGAALDVRKQALDRIIDATSKDAACDAMGAIDARAAGRMDDPEARRCLDLLDAVRDWKQVEDISASLEKLAPDVDLDLRTRLYCTAHRAHGGKAEAALADVRFLLGYAGDAARFNALVEAYESCLVAAAGNSDEARKALAARHAGLQAASQFSPADRTALFQRLLRVTGSTEASWQKLVSLESQGWSLARAEEHLSALETLRQDLADVTGAQVLADALQERDGGPLLPAAQALGRAAAALLKNPPEKVNVADWLREHVVEGSSCSDIAVRAQHLASLADALGPASLAAWDRVMAMRKAAPAVPGEAWIAWTTRMLPLAGERSADLVAALGTWAARLSWEDGDVGGRVDRWVQVLGDTGGLQGLDHALAVVQVPMGAETLRQREDAAMETARKLHADGVTTDLWDLTLILYALAVSHLQPGDDPSQACRTVLGLEQAVKEPDDLKAAWVGLQEERRPGGSLAGCTLAELVPRFLQSYVLTRDVRKTIQELKARGQTAAAATKPTPPLEIGDEEVNVGGVRIQRKKT